MINNKVLAIQCFVKTDTLNLLLKNLSKCYDLENYTVVFLIDSCIEMRYRNREHWVEENKKVNDIVQNYKENNLNKKNIILKNTKNLGCYVTCYNLIEYCMTLSDYVIFLEDDVILAEDALVFYEKTFTDHRDDERLFSISSASINENFSNNKDDLYILQKRPWVNSYEFGINKKVWDKYGYIRGSSPRGDFDFGLACRNNNMYTIGPKISRSCRIGIRHQNSYSAYHHNNIELTMPNNCTPNSRHFIEQDAE
jgi:hypothetical protein